MKRLKHLTIILVLAWTGSVSAQVKERFHADGQLFIQECREFLGLRKPEDTQAALKALENLLEKGTLEENQWIDLARISNRLEKLKIRPNPDFALFLEAFAEICQLERMRENYLPWTTWVQNLVRDNDKNLSEFNRFIAFTLDCVRNGILVKTSSFNWSLNPRNGLFHLDTTFSVRFQGVTLTSRSGGDSTQILRTSGTFYPSTGKWVGSEGVVTWEKVALAPGQVNARLTRYDIDLNRSVYKIDSVYLTDNRYFTEPLMGFLENKVQPGLSPEQAGYPRFTSYELKIRIKNLYPGMDYEGGYSLQGRKVLGTGTPNQKSQLIVFYRDAPRFRLASTYFALEPDMARGINTEASIYLDSDSIYHPGLFFQYNEKRKELALIRDGQGMSPSRYFDTYHDFDFDVEMIRWIPGDSLLAFSSLVGSIENRASFESADFFSIGRFNEILLEDKKHPVAVVKQCADYFSSRYYTLRDLADFLNRQENLVEEMLLRLSFLGFVRYSPETRMVEVLERAYDFLKKNAGTQDYDIIRFQSLHKPPEPNAILNLNNGSLKVFWVNQIELSQARNIIIYPDNQTVELLRERNILFDGRVDGTLLTCSGVDMRFVYDDFSIRMDSLETIRFRVFEEQADKKRPPKIAEVTSLVENTTATLLIDRRDNKSGYFAADLPDYPMLRTDSSAYVYYDQKEILNGVYPRKTFNFTLYPFLLKGLNSRNLSDSLSFKGQFVTADIFPPIELSLTYQKDHSLGFQTLKTPEEGYPIYKGKGRFYNTMAMSRSGLRGKGRLEYLSSAVESEDILFLPDQVVTMANTFAVNRDTAAAGNPETLGQEMAIRWTPEKDQLVASGKNNPLDLYGKVEFDGDLNLDPEGLTGKGTLKFDRFTISSSNFRFYQRSFDAADSELRIYRDTLKKDGTVNYLADGPYEFISRHMNGTLSIQDSMAVFERLGDQSSIEFPINRFKASTNAYTWEIGRNRIQLDSTRYQMALRAEDRLVIPSGQGEYLLNTNLLRAGEVEFVDVADMRIFPADRNVYIRESARIDSLKQAVLVSRDTSLVHRISGATVRIQDHSNYRGSGFYQYKDIAGREFPVFFSNIYPDPAGVSTGTGQLTTTSNFSLSPAFRYYGEVEWNNREKNLLFEGFAQIIHACNDNMRNWIRFKDRIDPERVSVPIDSITVNDKDERLFKGFYLSNQPVELYSTFVGPHLRYSDQALITSRGRLWYDEQAKTYRLASPEKMENPLADGPLLSFDSDRCEVKASGAINPGVDLGQVKTVAAGTLIHEQRTDSLYGRIILGIDFFLDSKLTDFMAKSINNMATAEPVNYSDPAFRDAFQNLIGKTRADELLGQLGILGRWRRVPEELKHTLTFTDLTLKWNPATGSYQSIGKLGIGNILDEPVNKKVDGYLEIIHRRGGDVLNIFIESDRQSYFFFTYSRGVMQCLAGPKFEKFNTIVREAKESKRIQPTGPGEPGYQYYLGQYRQVQELLRRFGIER